MRFPFPLDVREGKPFPKGVESAPFTKIVKSAAPGFPDSKDSRTRVQPGRDFESGAAPLRVYFKGAGFDRWPSMYYPRR
jgi:hypothetical protein